MIFVFIEVDIHKYDLIFVRIYETINGLKSEYFVNLITWKYIPRNI